MEILRLFVVGIVLGIANVIPGVSGGTMAVVFGVYDRLIAAITLDLRKLVKDIRFLANIGIGLIVGVLLFSRVVTVLFGLWPAQTNFFFMGIIVGSVPFIYRRARLTGFSAGSWVAIAAGIAVMVAMYVLDSGEVQGTETVAVNFATMAWLALMGFIAAVTMIIPGISGSFVLLILGAYATIIRAVSDLNIPLLVPVAVGVLAGLILGAQMVRFLLARFHSLTYGAIFGLVIGSILPVFPRIPAGAGAIAGCALALALGTFVSWFFSRTEKVGAVEGTGASEATAVAAKGENKPGMSGK